MKKKASSNFGSNQLNEDIFLCGEILCIQQQSFWDCKISMVYLKFLLKYWRQKLGAEDFQISDILNFICCCT
jgi:hypothetical protein